MWQSALRLSVQGNGFVFETCPLRNRRLILSQHSVGGDVINLTERAERF